MVYKILHKDTTYSSVLYCYKCNPLLKGVYVGKLTCYVSIGDSWYTKALLRKGL